MKHVLFVALAAAVLVNCAVSEAQTASCDVAAETNWRAAGGGAYAVEARTSGPSCAQAALMLTVRDAQGDLVWTDAFATAHVFGLNEAQSPAAMTSALNEWLSYSTEPQSSADLPDWPEGAEAPGMEQEFPFYPEEWIDREFYVAVRAQAAPMYCFAQGMESMACLVADGERLMKIGVQSFPG